jgi:hypothetical protein
MMEKMPAQSRIMARSCKTKADRIEEQRLRIHFLLYGVQVIGQRATMVIPPTTQAASPKVLHSKKEPIVDTVTVIVRVITGMSVSSFPWGMVLH